MSEAQVRHIYEQWHSTLMSRDLAGLVALYAEHAVFESPTVLAQFPDRDDGILRGRGEIEKLFARNFANLKTEFSELYRNGLFFSNGRLLTWEYPRLTLSGTQVDLFESMDIENGLIVYHRVYWGWQGLKALLTIRKS
ncbi:MAG: nuclear transport factor 2 family protein [Rhodospirillales bacterium]|nr:nuclear transport factor 2 family protein [Rhodospirillales bacterium]